MALVAPASPRCRRTADRLGVLAAASVPALTACYTSRPLPVSDVRPSQDVSLVLSDAGRAALAQQVGPSAASLEGRVESVADSGIVLQMQRSVPIRGDATRWVGERVLVRPAYVALAGRRSYSQQRTLLTVGVVAAAVGAFVLTRSINPGGTPGSPGRPPGGGQESSRQPLPP